MLLYYEVLIKISNLNEAAGQSISKYQTSKYQVCMRAVAAGQNVSSKKTYPARRHIQQQNIVTNFCCALSSYLLRSGVVLSEIRCLPVPCPKCLVLGC